MKKKKKMMNNCAPRDFCQAAYELADESYRREVERAAELMRAAAEKGKEAEEAAEEKWGVKSDDGA